MTLWKVKNVMILFSSSFFGIVLICLDLSAQVPGTTLPEAGVLRDADVGGYSSQTDYSRFLGRITDRDQGGKVFKVLTETANVKYFQEGDRLKWSVGVKYLALSSCEGEVVKSDHEYFVMKADPTPLCWKYEGKMRRGTILSFVSPVLIKRVKAIYQKRLELLEDKEEALARLTEVNERLWSKDQRIPQIVAEYARKAAVLKREREKEIRNVYRRTAKFSKEQKELMKSLNELDHELKFHTIDRQEILVDRFEQDHDLGRHHPYRPPASPLSLIDKNEISLPKL